MATSVVSAADWWARAGGDRAALVFGADSISYRGLRNWSSRVAQRLIDSGVRPGDRVALLGGNQAEWAAAAYGVLRAGAVLVPLSPRAVGSEVHAVLGVSGAATVITQAAFTPVIEDAIALGAAAAVLDLDGLAELREGPDLAVRVDRAPEDAVALLFTSGSTGASKAVVCTNRTLLDIVFEASLREEALRQGYRGLLVLPLAFTPGLVWGLVMCTVLGGTLFVEAAFDPAGAVTLIERHRVEVLFGVPLIYQAMMDTPEFAAADLSCVGSASVGGAAVPVALLKGWGAKGVALRQIYGMTEAGGIATATLPEEADAHPDSCGVGSLFTEFRVARPDGTQCAPGEAGEILLRGPGVTPGYWNDPATTAAAFRDGWLHTGDLGSCDEAGRLRFVDRLKDLIISGGINISPIEIEAVISELPGVAEVAVIPAPDERFGETPAAIVSLTGDAGEQTVDEQAVIDACAVRVADFKVPRYVVLRRDPLPRLPSGKIAKREVRAEYADIAERFDRVR